MLSLKYILIPLGTALLSQCIKIIIEYKKNKKIGFMRFFNGMGGIPSTHSALVSSSSTIIYLEYGLSPLFAVTLIFSLITIYDSMGIRYESGKQAKVINDITGSKLNEKIGHKPIETLAGILLGISFSILINIIIK